MYAAGRIPGSFFRREGRPSTDAILACRLIDRPLRPLFVKGLRNEVQVVITVLALHPDDAYDTLAINAASASTQISGLPFSGPVGAVRIALVDGQWVAFPVLRQGARGLRHGRGRPRRRRRRRDRDDRGRGDRRRLGPRQDEGVAAPTEEVVAEGIEAAKPFIKALCDAQSALAAQAAKPVKEYPVFLDYQDDAFAAVEAEVATDLREALAIADKQDRENRLDEIKNEMVGKLQAGFDGREKELSAAYRSLQKKLVRQRVLTDGVRIDGRGLADIRTLSAEVEVLPRVHGSALFERGETQIMGVTTLNMLRMEQQIDSLGPETRKRYMHNYNFPPYSTGETGASAARSAARSVTARSPSVRSCRCCRAARSSPTRSARCPRPSAPTARRRWAPCAPRPLAPQRGRAAARPVAGIAMGLISDTVDGETATRRSPTSSGPRTRSATWTSRSPARASSSRPSSSTPSSTASPPRCSPVR